MKSSTINGLLTIILSLILITHQLNHSIHTHHIEKTKLETLLEKFPPVGFTMIDTQYIGRNHPDGWDSPKDVLNTFIAMQEQGIKIKENIGGFVRVIEKDTMYRVLWIIQNKEKEVRIVPMKYYKMEIE